MSQIHIETFYPYAPELVWDALTDREALREWAMENDFKPVVGYKFQFRAKPNEQWNGIIEGEVLEVDRPRRLVYTWRTNNDKAWTTVTWKLEPCENGTQVDLQHTGFESEGGYILSQVILTPGYKKQMNIYLPVVLEHMQRNGLKFEKGKWLIPERKDQSIETAPDEQT
jgi:uncharacterized protein YndB with AHSA1/START domain